MGIPRKKLSFSVKFERNYSQKLKKMKNAGLYFHFSLLNLQKKACSKTAIKISSSRIRKISSNVTMKTQVLNFHSFKFLLLNFIISSSNFIVDFRLRRLLTDFSNNLSNNAVNKVLFCLKDFGKMIELRLLKK